MSAPVTRKQLERLSVGRSLAAVQRRWGPLNEAQGTWLRHQGVSIEAILDPTPIGAALVKFLGGTFDVARSEAGTRALTLRVSNIDGDDIDLVAWSPRSGEVGSWYGRAFALGQEQIDNPASYFDGDTLRIHADPLAWLKANRGGIVIIKPELTYAMLRYVPRVSFADFDTAKKFETWIKPPPPTVAMFVELELV